MSADLKNSFESSDNNRRRSIRWWPATILLLLLAGTLVWIWGWYGLSRQHKNIATAEAFLSAGFLLLVWIGAASRLPWKQRLAIIGGALGAVAGLALLFRIRGVTGDLVPVVEFRWKSRTKVFDSVRTAPALSKEGAALTNHYPQFLGPNRNGQIAGPKLERNWKATPPQLLWRQPIGAAWSGFVIQGHQAVTQEQRGEDEMIVCYHLLSGKVLWSHADPAHYLTTIAGEGPRATPTIASNRVFALGATGILNCLDLQTGKVVWSKNIITDNNGRLGEWGASCSPLVVDRVVVVSAGGADNRSLVAYQIDTGEWAWGAGKEGATYSSPCLATLAGTPQILMFHAGTVAGHDQKSGAVLWEYTWPRGHPHITLPMAIPGSDDRVLISSGYGTGAALLKISKTSSEKWTADLLWKSIRLKSKFGNLIFKDGYIYGLDDGILACLDVNDGALKWKEGRYGHGQMILVNDLLLIMAEDGEIVLLEPNPQELRVATKFPVLSHKTWNPPALAGDFLLVRNDKEAACFRLPVIR